MTAPPARAWTPRYHVAWFYPDVWPRLQLVHVADRTGHCRACTSHATGSPVWPCRLRALADEAELVASAARATAVASAARATSAVRPQPLRPVTAAQTRVPVPVGDRSSNSATSTRAMLRSAPPRPRRSTPWPARCPPLGERLAQRGPHRQSPECRRCGDRLRRGSSRSMRAIRGDHPGEREVRVHVAAGTVLHPHGCPLPTARSAQCGCPAQAIEVGAKLPSANRL